MSSTIVSATTINLVIISDLEQHDVVSSHFHPPPI